MFKNMGGNIPGGNFPGGRDSPGGNLMGRNFSGGSFPGGNFPDTVKNEWPFAYNCRILYFSVKNKLLFDVPNLIFKMVCLFNMNPAIKTPRRSH